MFQPCRPHPRTGTAPKAMPDRSPQTYSKPQPTHRLNPLPFGERRDAKQESPFHGGFGSVRRSLVQELQADRKR